VRQSKSLTGKTARWLIALAILAKLVAIIVCYQRPTSAIGMEPQAVRQQRRTRPEPKRRTQTQVKTVPPFASFKHESHRAPRTKLNCSDCHTIPLRASPNEVAAATKTTIKGFPYHDSCLECHRQTPPQFFRGATPSICTVCHTRSSPRLTKSEMLRFPKHAEEVIELEFPGYFPHDQADHKRVNCATCHTTDDRVYLAISVGGSESFKPAAGTFKTTPIGHAACFKCHWEEKPAKDDCAGCHLTPDAVAKNKSELISVGLMDWFKTWPREWPRRISIKFSHDSESHDAECITCHEIAKLQTLDMPKAEVPIAPCAKCHLKPATPANLGKEMFDEDEDIAQGRNNDPLSKAGKHTCSGCHSAAIGGMPPPCSHYLLFDDTYFNLQDYPNSGRQIAERCKK